MILETLAERFDTISTNATNIFSTLQKTNYDSSCTHDMFLNELQLKFISDQVLTKYISSWEVHMREWFLRMLRLRKKMRNNLSKD